MPTVSRENKNRGRVLILILRHQRSYVLRLAVLLCNRPTGRLSARALSAAVQPALVLCTASQLPVYYLIPSSSAPNHTSTHSLSFAEWPYCTVTMTTRTIYSLAALPRTSLRMRRSARPSSSQDATSSSLAFSGMPSLHHGLIFHSE